MSYNGSGTFTINSTGQPVVAGTVITASAFNALTADLATGLTTAITKDGQTTTTARIPFAQGINSSLVTDSSSTSTGSIITAGGVGIAKNLYVGGIASFSAQPIFTSLTASSAVATDASKGLISVTNTGTGNNVLATSPTITTPTISSLSSAAATALTLQSAGTTAITVDTSQNVGIGTVSPTTQLSISKGSQGNNLNVRSRAYLGGTTSSDSLVLGYSVKADTGATDQMVGTETNSGGGAPAAILMNSGVMQFHTASSVTSGSAFSSERMRIDSSGNLLVGTTNATITSGAGIRALYSATIPQIAVTVSTTSNNYLLYNSTAAAYRFFVSDAGQINATSTSITAISDQSLKENIRDLETGLAEVLALKPRRFDWKEETHLPDRNVAGFIAQEVAEILPELVYDYQYDENVTKKSLKMGDMLPTLVKAIQEQQALITAQAETINALTARIVALESK